MINNNNLKDVINFNKYNLEKVKNKIPKEMQWVINDTIEIFNFIINKNG